jgi:hypothetical protein
MYHELVLLHNATDMRLREERLAAAHRRRHPRRPRPPGRARQATAALLRTAAHRLEGQASPVARQA